MTPEMESRRRALVVIYRRYLDADRALQQAQREALSWFPLDTAHRIRPVGDTGSRIRRLYDRRDRAIDQFTVVCREIEQARRRTTRRVHLLALPPD